MMITILAQAATPVTWPEAFRDVGCAFALVIAGIAYFYFMTKD